MKWTSLRTSLFFLLLSLFSVMAVAMDVLHMDFGGGWELGYEYEDPNYFILEFVPDGQTVNNWSKLLTFQGFPLSHKPHRKTLRTYVNRMERRVRSRCRNTIWTVLWERALLDAEIEQMP